MAPAVCLLLVDSWRLPLVAVARSLPSAAEQWLPPDWHWLTDRAVAGNEIWRILGLVLSILLGLVAGHLLRLVLNVAAGRFERRGRPLAAVALRALALASVFALGVLGLQAGLNFLVLNDTVEALAASIVKMLATIAVGYAIYCLVGVVDAWLRQTSERSASKLGDMLVPLVGKSLRATVVVLVLVQIAADLSNRPATSIVAGLGVGALAVGLAAQDTIKNFFGSMMIFSDRPFEMGDVIIVDGREGAVEAVGFRSTRFRTPEGHLVTIPNGDLANKAIVNVSKRPSLVRKFTLALPAETSPEKVQKAVAIVEEILRDHEGMNPRFPPRVFFSELATTGVGLSISYWYFSSDWWKFMAFNQRVNLEIMRRFQSEGIAFTPPVQPA